MPEGGEGEGVTYTKEQLDAAIAESEAGLKAKRDELLSELKTAQKQLKALDGIDPEEVRTLRERMAELETERKAGEAKISAEQLKEIRGQVEAELEKRYGPLREENDHLKADNRRLRLDDRVKSVMAKARARPERIDALYKLTGEAFDLTEDGEPMVADSPGASVEEFIADEVAKQYPEFFEGSGSSGGGASKSVGGAGGAKHIAADDVEGWDPAKVVSGEIVVEMPG